jgi:hypothetical protein
MILFIKWMRITDFFFIISDFGWMSKIQHWMVELWICTKRVFIFVSLLTRMTRTPTFPGANNNEETHLSLYWC